LIKSEGLYAELARVFLKYNPKAEVVHDGPDRITMDVSKIDFWINESASSLGNVYLFSDTWKRYFTANGLMFFWNDKECTDCFRDFLSLWGHVPDDDLNMIYDNWIERQAKAIWEYIKSCDSEAPRKETPLPAQILANVVGGPLVPIGNLINMISTGESIYKPNVKASNADKVLTGLSAGMGIFGEFSELGVFGKNLSEPFSNTAEFNDYILKLGVEPVVNTLEKPESESPENNKDDKPVPGNSQVDSTKDKPIPVMTPSAKIIKTYKYHEPATMYSPSTDWYKDVYDSNKIEYRESDYTNMAYTKKIPASQWLINLPWQEVTKK